MVLCPYCEKLLIGHFKQLLKAFYWLTEFYDVKTICVKSLSSEIINFY